MRTGPGQGISEARASVSVERGRPARQAGFRVHEGASCSLRRRGFLARSAVGFAKATARGWHQCLVLDSKNRREHRARSSQSRSTQACILAGGAHLGIDGSQRWSTSRGSNCAPLFAVILALNHGVFGHRACPQPARDTASDTLPKNEQGACHRFPVSSLFC